MQFEKIKGEQNCIENGGKIKKVNWEKIIFYSVMILAISYFSAHYIIYLMRWMK